MQKREMKSKQIAMAQKKPKSGKSSGKTMRDFALNGVTYKVEYDDPSEVENPEIQKLDV